MGTAESRCQGLTGHLVTSTVKASIFGNVNLRKDSVFFQNHSVIY